MTRERQSDGAQQRAPRFRTGETGAGTVEYAGVAVVVAVIIGSLVMLPMGSQIGSQVRAGVQDVICDIQANLPGGGGSSCGESETPVAEDEGQPPPQCLASQSTQSHNSSFGPNVSIPIPKFPAISINASLMVGEEATATIEHHTDGQDDEYVVTVMDSLNREEGLGAGTTGDASKFFGADAMFGRQMQLGSGHQEVFDDPEAAETFAEEVTGYVEDSNMLDRGRNFASDAWDGFGGFLDEHVGIGGVESPGWLGTRPEAVEGELAQRQVYELGVENDFTAIAGGAPSIGSVNSTDTGMTGDDANVSLFGLPDGLFPSAAYEYAQEGRGQYVLDRGDDLNDPTENSHEFTISYETSHHGDATAGDIVNTATEYIGDFELAADGDTSSGQTMTIETDHQMNITGATIETMDFAGSSQEGVAEVSTMEISIDSDEDRQLWEQFVSDPSAWGTDLSGDVLEQPDSVDNGTDAINQLMYQSGDPMQETYHVDYGDIEGDSLGLDGFVSFYEQGGDFRDMQLVDAQYNPRDDGSGDPREMVAATDCLGG